MGLDTTHDCWHGPYSSFNRFRFSLAKQIGIDLKEYNGYGTTEGKDLSSIDHDLMPLFNHSDCDGELSVAEAEMIARGLQSVLNDFKAGPEMDFDFKENIIQFRNGCLEAIRLNETIEFS